MWELYIMHIIMLLAIGIIYFNIVYYKYMEEKDKLKESKLSNIDIIDFSKYYIKYVFFVYTILGAILIFLVTIFIWFYIFILGIYVYIYTYLNR